MSLRRIRRAIHRTGDRVQERVRDYSRASISVAAQVSRVARPVVVFAAGLYGGPVLAGAADAISHYPHQYQETVKARHDGLSGREAREEGRERAMRTTIHSAAAGLGGSAVAAVVGGLGAGATGLGGQQLTGLGSGQGILGLSNPLIAAPATTASLGAGAGASMGAGQGALLGLPSPVGAGSGAAIGAGAGIIAATPAAAASTILTTSEILSGLSAAAKVAEKLLPGVKDAQIPSYPTGTGKTGGGGDTPGEPTPGAAGGGIWDAIEKAVKTDAFKWAAGGALAAAVVIGARKKKAA